MTRTAIQRRYTQGTPCWASVMTHDLPASRRFYGALFGWEFRSGPQQLGPYVRALAEGEEVAGLGQMAAGRRTEVSWLPYLASDGADATADLVRRCGGTLAVGPLDSEEAGRMAIAADPAGAVFGVWEGREHAGQKGPSGAPGTPVWFELVVADTAAVTRFYPAVFGHDVHRTAGGGDADERLTLRVADRDVAGVRGVGAAMSRQHGPHWRTYFAVTDAEDTVRRAVELGGRVVRGAGDSVHGRTATLADHEDAVFSVLQVG